MKHVVGVSDMKLSSNTEDTIVTFALGSCIAIAIYDSVAKIGGILHYMLPDSSIEKNKAKNNRYIFGDTGIPSFFREAYHLGAEKRRLKVIMAGGASVLDINDNFNVGEKNIDIARRLFAKNRIYLSNEDVGGEISRTLYLRMSDGEIWFNSSNTKTVLSPGEIDIFNQLQ